MATDALRRELERIAEPWRPQPGDVLIGTVVGLGEREGAYGRYPILTVVDEAGVERAFHAYHTVARDELARQRPQPGELIGIAYHGRDPAKEYERYRIKVVREAEPDWSAIAAEAEAEREQHVAPAPADDIPF